VAKTETVEVKEEQDESDDGVETITAKKVAVVERKVKRELESDQQQIEVSATTAKKRRTRNSLGAF
jgi:hypothetical protein